MDFFNTHSALRLKYGTVVFDGHGAPVDGVTGDGNARRGSLYVDVVGGGLYRNTGTRTAPVWEAVAAGTASNQAIVTVAQNGLVKDWSPPGFDPDVTTHLFVDPSPQDWQANIEVSNNGSGAGVAGVAALVHRVGDSDVFFLAQMNGSAVTGIEEPTWSTDGSTAVNDGTADRPIVWTPRNLWAGAWQAAHPFDAGTYVFGGGFAWESDGGSGGNTGSTEPDWASAPNQGATIIDGDITWDNAGPAAVWSANSRRSFRVDTPAPASNYGQFNTISSTAVAGVDYVFSGQPTGLFGTTGATEPDWASAVSGDGSVWIDSDVMWTETTDLSVQKLVITGIVAPSGPRVLTVCNSGDPTNNNTTVTLEDQAEAENDYGAYAVSAEGLRINRNDANTEIGGAQQIAMIYANGQWQPQTVAS